MHGCPVCIGIAGFCGTREKTCSLLTVQMHLCKEGVCVQRVLAVSMLSKGSRK